MMMLEEIEIEGEIVLVCKKFNGGIKKFDGVLDVMQWQMFYYCWYYEGCWKIFGFIGYLLNLMGVW